MDSEKILRFVLDQYMKFKEYTRALIISMQLTDDEQIKKIFNSCEDK